MKEEGYLKFNAQWEKALLPVPEKTLEAINRIREALMQRNWLGVLPNGIGFGNISVRFKKHFLITGSATGGLKSLDSKHLSLVTKVTIDENTLYCQGETIASSESMTHAVLYQHHPEIRAVLHIHNQELWKQYLFQLPTSQTEAMYGTPEMAHSIQSVCTHSNHGVIVMGGHKDGIISYASSLNDALEELHNLR